MRSLGVSPSFARILAHRGFSDPEAARSFLAAGRESLRSEALPDLAPAVARLDRAVEAKEPIVVYGDYDVDGQTAVALMVRFLRSLGASVDWYIPDRLGEGYGLNAGALRSIARSGAALVLTVDCGATARAEAAVARELGLDLIITDHHALPADREEWPSALALVNPQRADSDYPFRGLAGCGVAFKVCLALAAARRREGREAPDAWQWSDLVAVGTIADVVPLLDENRAFVRDGLARLSAALAGASGGECGAGAASPGLVALARAAGLTAPVIASQVAFGLAPRLNAAGRIGDAGQGLSLLLAEGPPERLAGAAAELDQENRRRQAIEAEITAQARGEAEAADPAGDARAHVVWGEGWHPGVIGIVASRLVETYYRPALVISVGPEGARGSGRSIPGFDLIDALQGLADLFVQCGGHSMAAGFSLPPDGLWDRLAALRRRFEQLVRARLSPAALVPELSIDAAVEPDQLQTGLLEEIERMGPFGPGNPAPVLASLGLEVTACRALGGGGEHLRFTLASSAPSGVAAGGEPHTAPRSRRPVEAVGFRLALRLAWLDGLRSPIDAAYRLERDTWGDRRSVRLVLRDVRLAEAGRPAAGGPLLRDGRSLSDPAAALAALPDPAYAVVAAAEGGAGRPWGEAVPIGGPGEEGFWVKLARRSRVAAPDATGETIVHLAVRRLMPLRTLAHALERAMALVPDQGVLVVHWLFTRSEVESRRQAVFAAYPDDEGLRRIYAGLRSLGPGERVPGWYERLPATGLAWATAVFAELKLVALPGASLPTDASADALARWGTEVAKKPVEMGFLPSRKVDLRKSMIYNEGVLQKQEFGELCRLATDPDPHALLGWLERGIAGAVALARP